MYNVIKIFERTFSKERKVQKINSLLHSSGMYSRCFSHRINCQGYRDVTFHASCCEYYTSRDGHTARFSSITYVHNYMEAAGMTSLKQNVVWNEDVAESPKSLVEYVDLMLDSRVIALSSTELVIYLVHVVMMEFSGKHRQPQIEHGQIVASFLGDQLSTNLIADYSAEKHQSSVYCLPTQAQEWFTL